MLRAAETRLTPDEARSWALAVGVSGGLALVSDDLALLGAEARALLDDVIRLGRASDDAARAGHAPACGDLLDARGPRELAGAGARLSIADLAHPVATLE
jgi:hypothetical protein